MNSFAKRFKHLREKNSWTQDEVAERLGLSRPTIAGYESEEKSRVPREETLSKIADLFDTTIDYLLGRTEDPTPTNQKQEELDKWGLSKEANVFFKDFESLSDEDKQKAIEHIKFLKHLAEQKNKSDS